MNWRKEETKAEKINDNREYEEGDNLTVNQLNAIVNNSFFAVEKSNKCEKALSSFNHRGEYDALAEYAFPNIVSFGGSSYMACFAENGQYKPFTGITPPAENYWNIVGTKGERGVQGEQGVQGIQGEQGVKGDTGAVGPQGAQGPQGPQGIQGIQGEKGEKGDKGDKGDDGTSFKIIGTVSDIGLLPQTAEPGTAYFVGMSEPRNVYVFDIITSAWINQGAIKGEKGDKGDTGSQGPVGPQGATGPEGPQGTQGIQGVPGDKGDRGEKGDKGDKGDRGDIGPQGVAGRGISAVSVVGTALDIVYSDGLKDTIDMPSEDAELVESYTAPSVDKEFLLDCIYPVGTIYMSVEDISPEVFIGGTWIKVGEGFIYVNATSELKNNQSSIESSNTIIAQNASLSENTCFVWKRVE